VGEEKENKKGILFRKNDTLKGDCEHETIIANFIDNRFAGMSSDGRAGQVIL
jgi:hypothetical protein